MNDDGGFAGFDVVIGNPPYGNLFNQSQKAFIKDNFKSFNGNFDIYVFFIEKGQALLKPTGLLTFITPDTWLKIPQSINLRKLILGGYDLNNIVSFSNNVFDEANVNVIIFSSTKYLDADNKIKIIIGEKIKTIHDFYEETSNKTYYLNQSGISNDENLVINIYAEPEVNEVLKKIRRDSIRGVNLLDVSQGIIPYSVENHTEELVKNRGFHSYKKDDDSFGRWIQGRAIKRYNVNLGKEEYLKYGNFLHRPRKAKYFKGERILIQEITGGHPPRIAATLVNETLYHDPGIISCLNISNFATKYLLGLINSKLFSWYHVVNSPKGKRNQFPKILIGDIRNLPFKYSADISKKIIAMVTEILTNKGTDDGSNTLICESEIDQLVYQLYGLTEEEIKIVEGA